MRYAWHLVHAVRVITTPIPTNQPIERPRAQTYFHWFRVVCFFFDSLSVMHMFLTHLHKYNIYVFAQILCSSSHTLIIPCVSSLNFAPEKIPFNLYLFFWRNIFSLFLSAFLLRQNIRTFNGIKDENNMVFWWKFVWFRAKSIREKKKKERTLRLGSISCFVIGSMPSLRIFRAKMNVAQIIESNEWTSVYVVIWTVLRL